MADEVPSYLGYVQGGESTITDGTNGTSVITVNDLIPYFHLADGNKSSLIPVERLTNMTNPMNAAMVFSGAENETTFMVEVSNLSLSDGNKVLTLHVKPLEFHEGELLKSFTSKKNELNTIKTGKSGNVGIYIEITSVIPSNGFFLQKLLPGCKDVL